MHDIQQNIHLKTIHMKFKSLIFIVLEASMTCTDIYEENNRPIDIALWENGPLEKNADEG